MCGAPRARRACTGICLHACLLRAAARGGLPGMHWDFSYPAGWLAEVLPDIVCLWTARGGAAAAAPRRTSVLTERAWMIVS